MATLSHPLFPPVLHHAAPEVSDYFQFKPCEPPQASGAIRAYTGFIRPFSDDEGASHVLRALDLDLPVEVCGGRLSVDASRLRPHPAELYLHSMAVPFELLVLEFADGEHPRAYITSPKMMRSVSMPLHVRVDRSIWIDDVLCPALCVYSGSVFQYSRDRGRLEQFLDQTATYLAKYLIWLRTRLVVRTGHSAIIEVLRKRRPNREPDFVELIVMKGERLDGYWPGSAAPSGADQHLKTIRPHQECWCWTGKRYRTCCMPRDLGIVELHRYS